MLAITTARLLQYIAFFAIVMSLGMWFYEQGGREALYSAAYTHFSYSGA